MSRSDLCNSPQEITDSILARNFSENIFQKLDKNINIFIIIDLLISKFLKNKLWKNIFDVISCVQAPNQLDTAI